MGGGFIIVALTLALCSSSSAAPVVSFYPPSSAGAGPTSLALVTLVPSGRSGWKGPAGGWRRKGMRVCWGAGDAEMVKWHGRWSV